MSNAHIFAKMKYTLPNHSQSTKRRIYKARKPTACIFCPTQDMPSTFNVKAYSLGGAESSSDLTTCAQVLNGVVRPKLTRLRFPCAAWLGAASGAQQTHAPTVTPTRDSNTWVPPSTERGRAFSSPTYKP